MQTKQPITDMTTPLNLCPPTGVTGTALPAHPKAFDLGTVQPTPVARVEVPAFLREMADQLRTQDNLATSQPLYCVMVKDRVYGMSSDYTDKYAWLDDEGNEAPGDAVESLEDADLVGLATCIDGVEYERNHYIERDRFITVSLTRAGAEEHLRINGHNLPGAHIYVTSLYRTPDMIALREWILSLSAGS